MGTTLDVGDVSTRERILAADDFWSVASPGSTSPPARRGSRHVAYGWHERG
jgi:hypothetical protein